MSAATLDDLKGWFDYGMKIHATHMIVVCDTFDHDDYPVYAKDDWEARRQYRLHNGVSMQRVMEVYDLRMDKDEQMREQCAMHLPKEEP